MPVVDLHAGPSYICRVLSHRECQAMNPREEHMSLRLKGVQHCKAGGACGKRERRSESRLHFNDLGTSGMKIIESKHNRAATHTTKTLQSAMQL